MLIKMERNTMSLKQLCRTQQINGREGETATFLSRCFFTFGLRVFGFAPRHLNRYVAFLIQCGSI